MTVASPEPTADELAAAILEGVPPVMRAIRARMRAGRPAGLTIPQFRALLFVSRNPGTSLSGIAEHLGTSVPAASELVARLVRQGMVVREKDAAELRRIRLTLSDAGAADLELARRDTTDWLRALADGLDPARRRLVRDALDELRAIVERPGDDASPRDSRDGAQGAGADAVG